MRCLKNKEGYIYPWTEALAKRGDMVECDLKGNPVGFEAPAYVPDEIPSNATAAIGASSVTPLSDSMGADLAVADDEATLSPPVAGAAIAGLRSDALRAHLRGFGDKVKIEAYAKDRWDSDLDRRKSEDSMIEECVELAAVDG